MLAWLNMLNLSSFVCSASQLALFPLLREPVTRGQARKGLPGV